MRLLLTAQGGLTHDQLDGVGRQSQESRSAAFLSVIDSLPPTPGVQARSSWEPKGITNTEHSAFRAFEPQQSLTVTVNVAAPASASITCRLGVLVSRRRDETAAILVVSLATDEYLRFSLGDVHPNPTMATTERLRELAERTMGSLLAAVQRQALKSLQTGGYIAPDDDIAR